MSAQTTKTGAPTTERQKEIDRLEKDVESLRHLAGDAALTRSWSVSGSKSRNYGENFIRTWSLAARPDCTAISNGLTRWILLDSYFTDFIELHGTAHSDDDKALSTGKRSFHGRPVAIIGHQKGKENTKQRLVRNFGQPKPRRLPQGAASDAGLLQNLDGPFLHSSIRLEHPEFDAERNVGRAKRLHGTCAKGATALCDYFVP